MRKPLSVAEAGKAAARLALLLSSADEGSLLMVHHRGRGDTEAFDALRGLVGSFISCGAAFVRGNDRLQQRMAPHAPLLMRHASSCPRLVARMLTATYEGNRALCESISPLLIARLAEQLEHVPCSVDILDFFGAILSDPPIRRNQDLVMRALVDPNRKHLLILRADGSSLQVGGSSLSRGTLVPLPDGIGAEEETAYCRRLLALLVQLAGGRNGFVAAKMQVTPVDLPDLKPAALNPYPWQHSTGPSLSPIQTHTGTLTLKLAGCCR